MTSGKHATRTRARRRSVLSPDDTRKIDRRGDILISAERLFAERGYRAVSLRDIAADAEVPIALVNYYFGRKEELFGTLFERRKPMIQKRIDAMQAIKDAPPGPEGVELVVRAWAETPIQERESEGGRLFSLMMSRCVWDPGEENRRVVERYYDPLAKVFIESMWRVLPDYDQAQVTWGYEFALGALLMYLADPRVERLSDGREVTGSPVYAEDLIRFITAGICALQPRRPD